MSGDSPDAIFSTQRRNSIKLRFATTARFTKGFGRGYSQDNLFWFRRFYGDYPEFLSGTIFDALRQISKPPTIVDALRQISGGSQISETTLYPAAKSYAARSQSKQDISDALPRKSRKASIAEDLSIPHALRGESPATLLTF